MSEELVISYLDDNLIQFQMTEICVDGIYSKRNKIHGARLFDLKEDNYDYMYQDDEYMNDNIDAVAWDSPFSTTFSFEVDEEAWLRDGVIIPR